MYVYIYVCMCMNVYVLVLHNWYISVSMHDAAHLSKERPNAVIWPEERCFEIHFFSLIKKDVPLPVCNARSMYVCICIHACVCVCVCVCVLCCVCVCGVTCIHLPKWWSRGQAVPANRLHHQRIPLRMLKPRLAAPTAAREPTWLGSPVSTVLGRQTFHARIYVCFSTKPFINSHRIGRWHHV